MQSILIVETQYQGAVALSQMHTISSSTVLRFILYLVSLKLIATAPFYQKEDFILDYQLEIKQIVDYPRCRIYREFLRSLMGNCSRVPYCAASIR